MPQSSARPIRSLCLALPAYNEEAAIKPLVRAAAAAFDALDIPWRIVVVDDGSRDGTASVVETLMGEVPQLALERHPQNRGLGPAILTCLSRGLAERPAGVDPDAHLIVCMDADMTHPPSVVTSMIEAARDGADLVIASRFQPGSRQVGVPPHRQLMSWGARLLFRWFLGLPGVRDYTCGFRAFRASLVERGLERFGQEGLITRSGFACTDELLVHLAMLGPRIAEVPFVLRYDIKVGRSKMNLPVTIAETIKLLYHHRRQLRNATSKTGR